MKTDYLLWFLSYFLGAFVVYLLNIYIKLSKNWQNTEKIIPYTIKAKIFIQDK